MTSIFLLVKNLLLPILKRKAKRWTMNGFHIRKKVIVDHNLWSLLYRSNDVSESVKTSVNGKTELKTRKRLIFMWSLRKLITEAIVE